MAIETELRPLEVTQEPARHLDVFERMEAYRGLVYEGLGIADPSVDVVIDPVHFTYFKTVDYVSTNPETGEDIIEELLTYDPPDEQEESLEESVRRNVNAVVQKIAMSHVQPDLRVLPMVIVDTAAKAAVHQGRLSPDRADIAYSIWGEWANLTMQGVQYNGHGGHSREYDVTRLYQEELEQMLTESQPTPPATE